MLSAGADVAAALLRVVTRRRELPAFRDDRLLPAFRADPLRVACFLDDFLAVFRPAFLAPPFRAALAVRLRAPPLRAPAPLRAFLPVDFRAFATA
jgi:hypothetical protein